MYSKEYDAKNDVCCAAVLASESTAAVLGPVKMRTIEFFLTYSFFYVGK